MIANRYSLQHLPTIAQDPAQFEVLYAAQDFRTRLIQAIREAKQNQRLYV